MNDIQKQKLETLLRDRKLKIEFIRNFDEYFDIFVHRTLKNVVSEINSQLIDASNEILRVFNDDPYEKSGSRYFAMVQIISESNRRNHFYLDNTISFPSISFIGNELTGKVKVSTKIKEGPTKSREHEIKELNDVLTADILIEFISTIYS